MEPTLCGFANTAVTNDMTPERALQVTEEWVFDLIDEAAKNARQIYFVYLGFIAYGMLTVLSSTDRDLILNASVRLPVVNAQVPLTAFYLIAPLLCILIFVHLMIALVELRRLLLIAQMDPSAPRIYPWMVARAILLVNGRLAWQFTDRTQVALTIVSVYALLPLVLMAFAAGYARAHVPTFSYVIGAVPIVGSILALAFYLQMVGTPARTAFKAVRSEWILFAMLAVLLATANATSVLITEPAAQKRSAAFSHQCDVLASVAAHVCDRTGVAAGFQLRFPQKLAGLRFEGVDARVVRGADEDEAARCGDAPAEIQGPRVAHADRLQRLDPAQHGTPRDVAGRQVNGNQLSEGRILARDSRLPIPETRVRRIRGGANILDAALSM